ncbi:hypothetical protein F2P81_000260 [Scophthalmus maximus]|uniref:Uncharacterized protein n=1 Tax=Scophthalmus maximus TaxID=52904 RepID=A0A6A4TIQ2_SCOMX|nr:hypothetical protein F2P81_000260 [Scophthalmus maximus]
MAGREERQSQLNRSTTVVQRVNKSISRDDGQLLRRVIMPLTQPLFTLLEAPSCTCFDQTSVTGRCP